MPAPVPEDLDRFSDAMLSALPGLRAWVEPPAQGGDWWIETRSPTNVVAWRPGTGFGFFDVDGEEPATWVADVPGAVAHAVSVMSRGRVPT